MLFDLRSRRRRGAVRVIYLFLAIVMVAGLVLVGVGTGSNQGGLLNAFTNNGSGGGGNQVADQALQKALKAVKKDPTSAAKWGSLLQARYTAAGSGSNYNTAKNTYTAGGMKQLKEAAQAWTQYLKLSGGKPGIGYSSLAASVYQDLEQWKSEAQAWNYVAQSYAQSGTKAAKPYLCLAGSAYAAKETTKGDLAAAQALQLTPKLQRLTLQGSLKSAKTSKTNAEELLAEEEC